MGQRERLQIAFEGTKRTRSLEPGMGLMIGGYVCGVLEKGAEFSDSELEGAKEINS